MYGQKNTTLAGGSQIGAQMRQSPTPEAPCGGLNGAALAPRDNSEIDREMNALHQAIDTLAMANDELRSRLAPVSSLSQDTAAAAGVSEPTPSCEVAQSAYGARQRVQYLTFRTREAIDLLRC